MHLFARPEALFLLLSLPVLLVIAWYGSRRRKTLLLRFGRPEAIASLSSLRPRSRLRSRLCVLGSMVFIVVALAGPRWGKGESGVVIGRDLMIVLDLSKSMMADDMRDPSGEEKQRWQAAQAGIRGLVESLRQRGGHRIGLVVFAAKPWLTCPLTADYDHFLMRLDEFTPLAPPPELSAGPQESFPSGTRIGAALIEAVKWHDPRFPGYQDVLLISDGDDPSKEDRDSEIETGIRAALDAKVPVHVVAVGDPDDAKIFSYRRSNGDEEIAGPTRLVEEPLKEIARLTHGEYLPARRDRPNLAEFFQTRIEPRPSRELPDDALPQSHDRSVWFLIPAIVLILAAWLIEP
jgi:Ca-activated chloride channel homolog